MVYHADDWHKSEKSRMHILGLVYLSKSFLPNKAHQPHRKAFMEHLECIVIKNPEFAKDCQLDDIVWNDIKDILKAMWRKYYKSDRKECNNVRASSDTARLFLDPTKSDVKH